MDPKNISPGLRFGLFYQGWKDASFEPFKEKKLQALELVRQLGESCVDLLDSLRSRQSRLASTPNSRQAIVCDREVVSQAPFVTGMGLEHPLENGFSFLHPYGLPYLPGSSVKGVVRRAAEELALFEPDTKDWDILRVWWLFGFDSTSAFFQESGGKASHPAIQKERQRWLDAYLAHLDRCDLSLAEAFASTLPKQEDRSRWTKKPIEFLKELPEPDMKTLRQSLHIRGALRFWDVYPKPPKDQLRVDIMNPHYNHYYPGDPRQGKRILPPGDWGTPNPIYFLTMPAGSAFRFVVEYKPVMKRSVQDALAPERVKLLLEAALEFAFAWLGFGAKTSIGYGLMASKPPPAPEILATAPAPAGSGQRGSPSEAGGAQHRGGRSSPGAFPPRPRQEEPKKATSTYLPPLPRQDKPASQVKIETEYATLVSEIKGGKATINLSNQTQIECLKIPEYPKQPPGSKCKVKVKYQGGKPVKAVFDRWGG